MPSIALRSGHRNSLSKMVSCAAWLQRALSAASRSFSAEHQPRCGHPSTVLTHVMLLDNFLKAGVIKLCELGQVMDIGNHITEIFLKQRIVIF